MINFENKKVLFIDLDSTLIKTISGKTFPEDITDFRIQLPVLDKIVEKLPNLRRFFIVTNQGGLKSTTAEWDFKAKLYTIEYFAVIIQIIDFLILVALIVCIALLRIKQIPIESLILQCQKVQLNNGVQNLKKNV